MALASTQDALHFDKDALRRKVVSQDEQVPSLCQTVKTFQASVFELVITCDSLRFKVTARTLEMLFFQAGSLVIASGLSQLSYDAVVCEHDHFVSILRFLTDHTGRFEDDFTDLFFRTRTSHLLVQLRI